MQRDNRRKFFCENVFATVPLLAFITKERNNIPLRKRFALNDLRISFSRILFPFLIAQCISGRQSVPGVQTRLPSHRAMPRA